MTHIIFLLKYLALSLTGSGAESWSPWAVVFHLGNQVTFHGLPGLLFCTQARNRPKVHKGCCWKLKDILEQKESQAFFD